MPFEALQKLTSRTPQTSNLASPQLDVVARATDPFAQQGRQGGDIIAALSSINPALKSYGDMQEAQKVDNQAQAKLDEKNGVYNAPSGFLNQGVGYSDTWKMTHGEALMSKVSSQHLQDLKDHNYFINEPDPQAAIKQNYEDHYNSAFTPEDSADKYTMAGASEHYHATQAAAEQGYLAAFNANKTYLHEQDINDTAVSTVQDYFRTTVSGKRDPQAVRQLLSTLRHSVDPSTFPEAKVGGIVTNALMGAARANMQDTRIPLHEREEFNQMVIEAARKSDKDGISWYKTLDQKTGEPLNRNMVDQTEAELHRMAEHEETKAEEKLKKDQIENSAGIMSAILSSRHSRDLDTFIPILKDAVDQGYISREHLKDATYMINTLKQGGGHIIEKPTDINALYYNVLMGKVKSSEIYHALGREEIRPDTADKMMGLIERNKAHQESLNAEGRNTDQQLFNQSYTQQHQTLYGLYVKTDDARNEPDTMEKWGAVQDYYNDLVYSQKKSPVQAKIETLKAFPEDGAMGGFKTAQEAQAEGRRAKVMLGTGAISRAEYNRIMAKVKPWAYRHGNQR
jgi:hypothetical protein